MKFTVCQNFEWTYPDVHSYATSSDTARCTVLRGGTASFQIHIYECAGQVSASCDIGCAELFEEIAIPVEACPGMEENEKAEHFPERRAPFSVNDCLRPYRQSMKSNPSCTLYVCIKAEECGTLRGHVYLSDEAGSTEVPVEITVSAADLPHERLEILMGFSGHCMGVNHKVENKEEYLELEEKYLAILRRMHQNRLYISPPFRKRGENGTEYDFREFDRYVKKALEMGFHSFHLPDVGYRRSWESDVITVGGFDYRSAEGRAYLESYLGALKEHIYKMGWDEPGMFSIGVADEPNEINSSSFVELSHMVKELIPEMKIYDAVADTDIDIASIDIWVPRCDQYEQGRERFEALRQKGAELWHYVCLFPRAAGYINRFMDIPLLCTRYLYWGNFRYSMNGYLHWTVNDYQSGCDPFKTSCPEHVNAGSKSILPPGDDKLIYPGDGEPLMSIRLENHRESAEEYAMLCAIAEKDRALADRICRSVMRSFCDTELNPCAFYACRERLIKEYENLFK